MITLSIASAMLIAHTHISISVILTRQEKKQRIKLPLNHHQKQDASLLNLRSKTFLLMPLHIYFKTNISFAVLGFCVIQGPRSSQ